MPDGLIVIGLDFDVMYGNRAFAVALGRRRSTGDRPQVLRHIPGLPLPRSLPAPWPASSAGVERLVYEADKHCMCGRLIPSIVTAVPYRQADGSMAGHRGDNYRRQHGQSRARRTAPQPRAACARPWAPSSRPCPR
ncbi:MAG: PAS domain-containing protein [Desulfobacterales bacterium]|nr:PAS domain-containing protein [Desulfobacterales bacterium]